VVLDYRPPTPIHSRNLIGHILFGIAGTPVDSVMVGGRFLMKSGDLVGIDEERILARSKEAAARLWEQL